MNESHFSITFLILKLIFNLSLIIFWRSYIIIFILKVLYYFIAT
jgi:hypothetical protein